MLIKDSEELRKLTSSWYASNDFERIEQDIELETEELAKIVGDAIIEQAEAIAEKEAPSEEELSLLKRIQLPIALMSTFRYYQSNIVSHDQSTRKIKIDDENEKLPWEWMLDRDDAAHLSKAQRAVDRLIAYLDKSNNSIWNDSDQKKAARKLFVNNTEAFGEYYPIDNSARFYYLALPLLKEVQTDKIRKALGPEYKLLLEALQNSTGLSELQQELLELTRRAQVLATIALAVRRLNTKVLPDGIVKAMKSERQTINANRPADLAEISYFSKRMEMDSFEAIDEIKRKRYENSPEYLEYKLLPNNDPKDKFAST
ncbi:hypothetical protein CHU00_17625 [Sphingobacterium cellulitidis]|uniref:DUF6712 family protein n=1 Tax=Sphingobacterium cellulitidis TaxID=1768011 RepID=UPI000B94367E|nr:DUF6712 family protein [Sphingobacterium cellulitidis]OYD44329.1 hypothetical protein CHU00_17625 [Sphingobacterium cellulitidis]